MSTDILTTTHTPATVHKADSGVPDSTASMVAMINALLEMETVLSNVLGKKSEYELNVQKSNAEAVKTAGDNVLEQVKKAEEAASHSSFWGTFGEIFGWVAAALTTVLSFGTLSVVAAVAVSAATVAMQSGAFNQGPLADLLDKISGGQEWAKDLIACGMIAATSLGAGLTSEALAAGANAAKSALGDTAVEAAEEAAEDAGSNAVQGQFGTVSKLTAAQAIITFGPQVLQDMFVAMHVPKEVAQGLAISICVMLSIKTMKAAFASEGFDIEKAGQGIAGKTLATVRTLSMYGSLVADLATTGFGLAKGVYAYKQGEAVAGEAAPRAMQEFMRDFTDIFNQMISRNSTETSQMMDNFRTINENFSQLTAPLATAARVVGSN